MSLISCPIDQDHEPLILLTGYWVPVCTHAAMQHIWAKFVRYYMAIWPKILNHAVAYIGAARKISYLLPHFPTVAELCHQDVYVSHDTRLWPRLGGLHRRLHERLQVKPSQTFVSGPASRVKPVLKPSAAYTVKVKP